VTLQTLILRYEAFAVIATVANLATQRVVIGLTIGYVVKYNLDQRFVFTDRQLGAAS
jgi:hypothetical protein